MDKMSKTGAAIGYLTIGLLALSPLPIVVAFNGAINDIGRPPYVVFALLVACFVPIIRPLWLVVTLHPHPTRQLIDDLRTYGPWLLGCMFILLALAQTMEGAGAVKLLISHINPFWADPPLIALDRAIFFGYDAWQVTHAALPVMGTVFLDEVYRIWHAVQIFFCTAIALLTSRQLQFRTIMSFQLSWLLLGNGLAVMLSSVGPVFAEPLLDRSDFTVLVQLLEVEGAKSTIFTIDYLLQTKGTNAIGAGISAMPSMHVGVAVIVALFTRECLPRFQWIAWLFAILTFVGSIHLGFHYATDGAVSAVAVVAIWIVVGRYVAWLSQVPEFGTSERPGTAA